MNLKLLILFGMTLMLTLANLQALRIDSVSMNPEKIAPGETSVIKLNLENNGETDISNLNVVLDLSQIPFAPYNSASESSIESLDSDKTKNVEFKIIALNNAESGIYKIPVKINYNLNDEIEIKYQESLISITVNSVPIISADLEDGLLLKSKENQVSFKIVNKGLSEIKFLEIYLDTSLHYTILSPRNIYVGDIDSHDFDSADFKIYFKETSPMNINLPVTLKYKDSFNKEYTQDFDLQAKVYTKEQAIQLGLLAKSNTLTYTLVIAVLIIIWLVYRKWKKSRKIKKIKQGED